MSVGIVLAAHVAELADGVARLAGQMAPEVSIVAAGGTDDGGIGTSFERIEAAVGEAQSGSGVLVLYDLGSAQLTAQLVAELTEGVQVQDAPLAEGAVAAAVMAATNAPLEQVAAAAANAVGVSADPEAVTGTVTGTVTGIGAATAGGSPAAERVLVLPNPLGLHARPAAALARLGAEYDAELALGRPEQPAIPVSNVISVVAAGIRGSEQLRITATGPQAEQAVDAASALAESGFGELEPVEQAVEAPPTPGSAASGAVASEPAVPGPSASAGTTLVGVAAAPGLAVGPVVRLHRGTPRLPDRTDADPDVEQHRLDVALRATATDLAVRVAAGGPAGEIARAHQALLADPELAESVRSQLTRGAERAWWDAATRAGERLGAQGRAVDLEDLARAVLAHLGVPVDPIDRPERLAGSVLVATDLLPSQVGAADEAGAAGLALAGSARTAHAAIIARGLGLPTVLQLGEPVLQVPEGRAVVLDGDAGLVHTHPDHAELSEASDRAARLRARRSAKRAAAVAPVDGVRVMANVGGIAEASAAIVNGADGVGLLRTEFLFLNRPDLPDEDEQTELLAEILAVTEARPVTIRTLDVGGDKMLPALALDLVRNGPLGERGLRYGLRHEGLLRTQIRAILRAIQRRPVPEVRARPVSGPVSVMAPMVTGADEARAFVGMVRSEAARLGVPVPPTGVMVEVPAAALDPAPICAEVDFVSVGTNDLAQYLLAADRTLDLGPVVGRWDHPAVFTAVGTLTAVAVPADCPVAVCGELAGDPDAAERLVRLGVTELSMAPASIPDVKRRLRSAL